MRQIKFRCLWEGVLHYATLDEIISHVGFDYGVPQNVLAFTEGEHKDQFTGLLDREGVEIYESDILHNSSWWWGNCFVYWNQGECGPCSGDSAGSHLLAQNLDNPADDAVHNIWYGREVEVIGNIHQNPELLK